MIGRPHNDEDCLGPATDVVIAAVAARDPAIVDLAAQFDNTDDLAAWFRTLPQRDDEGLPCDGPKLTACRPAQRMRLDADDPNCFERGSRFVGAAEVIDPSHVYRLRTEMTPNGLHTFPTRDGVPVILDPIHSRNGLRAAIYRAARNAGSDTAIRRLRLERLIGTDETRGVRGDLARARAAKAAGHETWVNGESIDEAIAKYERALVTYQELLDSLERNARHKARNASPRPVVLTPTQAINWIADIAAEPAARIPQGPQRVRNGHRALLGVLVLRPICVADAKDVALTLALAEREARAFGPAAMRIVHSTARAVDQLDRLAADRWLAEQGPSRNAGPFELRIGDYTIGPNIPLISSLAKVGGRIAGNVGLEALKIKLATMGISPAILNTLEGELNHEGLSLGPLAKPAPMLGTLASMDPESLAGRWLAQKF